MKTRQENINYCFERIKFCVDQIRWLQQNYRDYKLIDLYYTEINKLNSYLKNVLEQKNKK